MCYLHGHCTQKVSSYLSTSVTFMVTVLISVQLSGNKCYLQGHCADEVPSYLSASVTFMARVTVLIMMSTKMPYSKAWEVTNHQILYCHRAFGMYRRIGFTFSANSIHFLCNINNHILCTFRNKLYTLSLKHKQSHTVHFHKQTIRFCWNINNHILCTFRNKLYTIAEP